MVKINVTAACSWADIGSLLFFFYLSILKRSMVPCFGLPQKRGDSLNNRFKTDTSHFSSFALKFQFSKSSNMLSRERLQKTSGGLRRRKLPTINRDTLHFVSTTSPNFCFPGEAFKLAVIASISQNVGRSGISRVAFRDWKTWRKTTFNDRK